MAKMPSIEASLAKKLREYSLGVIEESGWILGLTLVAYLMAVAATWYFGAGGGR
ncbi:MAG: hypothetical protein Q7W30_03765 [Coriobacteriia bacterium]|nr:hypothetical protein [Coriobacteriia bacterium]